MKKIKHNLKLLLAIGGYILYLFIMISITFLIPDNSNEQDEKCIHRVYCGISGHYAISTTCGVRWAEDSIKSVCPFCGKKFKIVVSSSEEIQ